MVKTFFSNCLFFALYRWYKHGGYFIIRGSRLGKGPHFIWAKSLEGIEVEQFVPVNTEYKAIPPVIFKGFVKRFEKDAA